jgi:transposase
LSQRPHRRRTWAPRGQTPVLQFHFNWKTLSVIAGLTIWNFYFQIFEQAIRSEQIIEFLKHLLRYIQGNILVIWDRLPAHKSAVTQQFIRDQRCRLEMEYLPPYAPELNPVEYIWAHCKHHELPNVCAKNLWDLSTGARRSLKRMRRRPRLITAFWKQASLFDCFRYIMRDSVSRQTVHQIHQRRRTVMRKILGKIVEAPATPTSHFDFQKEAHYPPLR